MAFVFSFFFVMIEKVELLLKKNKTSSFNEVFKLIIYNLNLSGSSLLLFFIFSKDMIEKVELFQKNET